ncbi:HAD superfamily hydrolase [Mucinivorans hirudinis]|uniref:HAD superfamily hydrolase n=1 Tax=Mucinivorans hirudinis TaxID=1433126 RepID=A0A060RER7_9BACT|nr:HAD superfamily hydrolase [Mucinivorans hirudinis]
MSFIDDDTTRRLWGSFSGLINAIKMVLRDDFDKKIRNIIFDLGNVLWDIDISLSVRAFARLGLTGLKETDIHPNNIGLFLDLEIGAITNAEFWAGLSKFNPTRQVSEAELSAAWNLLLLPIDFRRYELLDRLHNNYNVYLLSNTNLPHREYFLTRFFVENPAGREFESYFDRCFYSDAMHLRKPDPRIYSQLLEQAGIRAEESLFIDDNAPNLVGANEVGLHTYHLKKPEKIFNLFFE